MRRREVVAGVGASILTASRALAQNRARIGWLTVAPHPGLRAFLDGMRGLGWLEADTLAVEYAYAEGRPERLVDLANTLAHGGVQLVVASGSDAVVEHALLYRLSPSSPSQAAPQ
jgi:putative tryptophan/tyrosine transport system substrate-binding protein